MCLPMWQGIASCACRCGRVLQWDRRVRRPPRARVRSLLLTAHLLLLYIGCAGPIVEPPLQRSMLRWMLSAPCAGDKDASGYARMLSQHACSGLTTAHWVQAMRQAPQQRAQHAEGAQLGRKRKQLVTPEAAEAAAAAKTTCKEERLWSLEANLGALLSTPPSSAGARRQCSSAKTPKRAVSGVSLCRRSSCSTQLLARPLHACISNVAQGSYSSLPWKIYSLTAQVWPEPAAQRRSGVCGCSLAGCSYGADGPHVHHVAVVV